MNAKTILHSLVFIALVVVSGCEDDKEEASIVGRWIGTQATLTVTTSNINVINETDNDFDAIVEFKEDGTVTVTRDGQVSNGTYTVTGDQLETTVNFNTDFPTPEGDFEIQALTQASLQLFMDQEGTIEIPNMGTISGTAKATFFFTRVP